MATRNRIEIEIGARNNATRELTNAAKSLRDLESTFTKISTLFAGGMAGGMIASAIGGTITKFASLGEELGKLRVATGLTYGQLQTLQRALEEAGTAPEALNTATRILNVNIAQGDKTLAKYGITARDTYGAILQVGKRLAGLGSSAEKAELGMAAFGRSSQDLIDTIIRFATDPDMRRGLEAVSLSDAQVEKFQKLDERLDKAGRAWKRLFNEIAGAIEPVASTLLGTINLITELEAKGDADTYRRMAEMRFRTGSAGALMFSAHGQNAVPPPIKTTPSGGTSPERTFYGNLPDQYGYGPPTAPAGWLGAACGMPSSSTVAIKLPGELHACKHPQVSPRT